jgi:hypothetical protein
MTDSLCDVKLLLGFTHWYRIILGIYAMVLATICHMSQGTRKWEWTPPAELGFRKLKKAFSDALILQHLNMQSLIILLTDASDRTIAGILN